MWLQFFKRSPINFRRILGVPKGFNPKGLALFLSGYCNLFKQRNSEAERKRISELIAKLFELRSSGWSGDCWGYNFTWQSRAFFQPRGTPNVVVSSYVGQAFLSAYEVSKDEKLLDSARSTCDFILKDLKLNNEDNRFTFSYSPLDRSKVINASLLAARLLSQVYRWTKEDVLIQVARKAVEFACSKQNSDGSWVYGLENFQGWIDSFHTGYNLECINEYQSVSNDTTFDSNIKRGLDYYISNFFENDGAPKYYNNKKWPIDIHCPAQLVVTISKLNKLKEYGDLVDKVLGWTLGNMQDESGYFYFQKNGSIMTRIPYIRWAQAWMFYAMSCYLAGTQYG